MQTSHRGYKAHDWACERLATCLRSTGTKVKTQGAVTAVDGNKRGDLELAGYIGNGAQDLVLDLSFRQRMGEPSSSVLERWREDDITEQEDWENMVMKDVRILAGKQNVASSRSEMLRPLQVAAVPENDVGRGDSVMVAASRVKGSPVATSVAAPFGPVGRTEVERRQRGMGGAKGASGPTLIRPEDIDMHSGTFASRAGASLCLSRNDA